MKKSAQVLIRGFTLVELLIVIAIIAILAAVVVLIINPVEITKRTRDATRLSDLTTLQNAINVSVQEATGASGYALYCNDPNATTDCTGTSNPAGAASQAINGTGWVKINLSNQNSVQVPTLPVDPLNNSAFHYRYCGTTTGWKMLTRLESIKESGRMLTDGGSSNADYETGSVLSIACTY